MAMTRRAAKRRGTWRTTNDGQPFKNNYPTWPRRMAYMMTRKGQEFWFNSLEKGPWDWKPPGQRGQHTMGLLIEAVSRYNNKVYRNTVLSKPNADHRRPHSNGGLFVTAARARPSAMTGQDRDLRTPWMGSSKAGLTARRCAQVGGYARA